MPVRKMLMWGTVNVVLLCHISMAYVVTYQWQFQISKDTLAEISQVGNSYYDEKAQLLDSYTGPKAQYCKDKLGSEAATRVSIQTQLMRVTGQVEAIDKEMSENVQTCNGDECCISEAKVNGESKLIALKCQVIPQLMSIKENSLRDITNFMDSCIVDGS